MGTADMEHTRELSKTVCVHVRTSKDYLQRHNCSSRKLIQIIMEKNLIPAPIDNKNLMEDPFEDEVFGNFYAAPEHRSGATRRHLVGSCKTEDYDAIVDVKWFFGSHSIDIQVIAVSPSEDYETVRDDVFDHYEKIFKSWECDANRDLRVMFKRLLGILTVSFYFETE